jgi:hypothetical protein
VVQSYFGRLVIRASEEDAVARLRIGDVVEVPVSKGLVYAHYTHRHPEFGALLRVFGDIFTERPSSADLNTLVRKEPQFITFFPLQAALKHRIVSIAANAEPGEDAKQFPLFRDGVLNPATKRVDVWWLWDGEKEWRVGDLTEEQRKLPMREVINDTLLIERIESGWRNCEAQW